MLLSQMFFFIWLYLDILYTYKSMQHFDSLCSFWQDDRGFSWYQNFHFDCLPLFISPWQQILFSICHSYLSLHLLLILHCFFLHVFPPALSLFAFLTFLSQASEQFLTFWESCIFQNVFVLFFNPHQKQHIFLLSIKYSLKWRTFLERIRCLWPCDLYSTMHL